MSFLTLDQMQEVAAKSRYPPGWCVTVGRDHWGLPAIAFRTETPDARRPGETTVLNIVSPLPPMPDAEYFTVWIHWRLGIIALHEVDEHFTYLGKRFFDPHTPVNADYVQ